MPLLQNKKIKKEDDMHLKTLLITLFLITTITLVCGAKEPDIHEYETSNIAFLAYEQLETGVNLDDAIHLINEMLLKNYDEWRDAGIYTAQIVNGKWNDNRKDNIKTFYYVFENPDKNEKNPPRAEIFLTFIDNNKDKNHYRVLEINYKYTYGTKKIHLFK